MSDSVARMSKSDGSGAASGLPLNSIRVFVEVARAGSFSRAAEAARVSQPTLSAQVKALEGEYGVTLFDRRGRQIRLTRLGRRLLDVADRLFALAEEARAVVAGTDAPSQAFLSVAADGPAHALAVLGALEKRIPGLDFALSIGNSEEVVRSLLAKTDYLLIGGGMANTFLKAKGLNVGASLVEDDALDTAKALMDEAGGKLILPVDAVVADKFAADAQRKVVSVSAVPEGWRILDIGPDTVKTYTGMLHDAKTVVWNGPMGVFEMEKFSHGSFDLARAIANLDATTVVGGGETAAVVAQAGLQDRFTHVSTGGGASLEMLEGRELPGVAALLDA